MTEYFIQVLKMSEKEHTRNFKIKLMGSRGLVIPDKQEKIVKFKDRAGGTFGFKPTNHGSSHCCCV